SKLTRADRWILVKLDSAIAECDAALGPLAPSTPAPSLDDKRVWRPEERFNGLRLNEYAESARRFVWNELADWYVETAKGRLNTPGPDRDVARAVLVHCFDQALRLLHPIVPFGSDARGRGAGGQERVIADESAMIGGMSRATIQSGAKGDAGAAAHAIVGGCELTVPLAGLVDVAQECERLQKELTDLDKQIESRS